MREPSSMSLLIMLCLWWAVAKAGVALLHDQVQPGRNMKLLHGIVRTISAVWRKTFTRKVSLITGKKFAQN